MSRLAVLLYRKGRHNIRETYVVPSFFFYCYLINPSNILSYGLIVVDFLYKSSPLQAI